MNNIISNNNYDRIDEGTKIRDIGTILKVDENGFIINQSSLSKIHEPWILIVRDIVEAYKKYASKQLHSIYIKGSVGRGTPISYVSDIDCLILLKDLDLDLNWKELLKQELKHKYPFCVDFDLVDKDIKNIISGKNKIAPVLLKTMATCAHGDDIIPKLPDVRPGKGSIVTTWHYKKYINERMDLLNHLDKNSSIESMCKGIMKMILRTGFELVMEKEQCFTRDLYPCYKIFSKYYPEKEKEMKEVLFLALNNTNDKKKILDILNTIGVWMIGEIEDVYGIT